jgi:hypothetical protein
MDKSNRDYDIEYRGAFEQSDGSYIDKFGYIKWYNELGQCHREDGPGVIYPEGDASWYLNGQPYLFADWLIKLNKSDEDAMMLRLRYA